MIIKVTTNCPKLLNLHRLPKFSRKSQQYRLGSRTRAASSVQGSRLIQLIQSGNCFPSILALRSRVTWQYIYLYILPIRFFSIFSPILSFLSLAKWQSFKALRHQFQETCKKRNKSDFLLILRHIRLWRV